MSDNGVHGILGLQRTRGVPEARGLVLVVEDESAVLLLAQETLAGAGYTAALAENVRDALALASERPPTAIVLDAYLPDLGGLEFARAYRNAPGPRAPIVALSGNSDVALFAALVGAAAYVAKPFNPADLIAAIERVTLKRHSA